MAHSETGWMGALTSVGMAGKAVRHINSQKEPFAEL
jgi:hypothetical protein